MTDKNWLFRLKMIKNQVERDGGLPTSAIGWLIKEVAEAHAEIGRWKGVWHPRAENGE